MKEELVPAAQPMTLLVSVAQLEPLSQVQGAAVVMVRRAGWGVVGIQGWVDLHIVSANHPQVLAFSQVLGVSLLRRSKATFAPAFPGASVGFSVHPFALSGFEVAVSAGGAIASGLPPHLAQCALAR